ncbi:MAG: DUF116 domain-containing protein [Methanimicrococcus sp.]|nr:DUF116 domain-containing protein [Methanimicrococcus sp.]
MYDELGRFVVFGILFSFLLLLIAFYIIHTKLQNNALFASYAARIFDFFYKPLLMVYIFIYKSPDKLHAKMAEIKNNAHRKKFIKTKNRIIIAPHCMRHIECRAKTTRTGIQCTGCGKCSFSEIRKLAEKYNYKLYIITGSSFVKHILKHPDSEGTDGVLAIGCTYEINKGMRELKGKNLVTYGIPLLSSGCYNTDIDLEFFEKELIYFEDAK